MAKKDKIDVSSNIDDFGDFDFNGMDESGFKMDQVATPSKMRSDYIPAMRSGFLSGLKQELDSKMPYTAAVADQVMSIFNEAKSMTSEFASEAGPLVRSIGRSTNRLMPLVRPFMPKKAYDSITGKLSAIPDEQGEISEEERQSQQISADINAAFQGSDAQAQVRENMGQFMANTRHKATMGAISGVVTQIQSVNQFLGSSLLAYMKKDLELQYRQLYVQKDISSTLRATAKLLDAELKNITHNTGLPEQVKAKSFEKRKTKRMKLREYMGNFAGNFMKNIKRNILDQIKDGLSMVADASAMGAEAVDMSAEMGEPVTLSNMFKKLAFNVAGKWVGGKAGSALSRAAMPFLQGGWESGMQNLGHSLINGMKDYADTHDGFFAKFLQMGMDGEEYRKNPDLRNDLEKDPTKTVQFDISTREAIVTIIPGYLAKIHQVIADIQDPSTRHEELGFDVKSLSFTGKSEIRKEAARKLDAIIKPDVWGTQDHLSVIAVGRVLRGDTAADIDKWLKETDASGITNRQNVTQAFINMSRIPGTRFRPEWLKAVYTDPRNAESEHKRYWRQVMENVTNRMQVAAYIVEAVTNPDGSLNIELLNQYEIAITNFGQNVDFNTQVDQIEDIYLNGPSDLKSEFAAYAESIGLVRDGKVNESVLNRMMAEQMSSEKLGDKISSWTNEKLITNAKAAQNSPSFNIRVGIRNMLDWMGNTVDPEAEKVKTGIQRHVEDLKKVFTDGAEAVVATGAQLSREIIGDKTMDAFNATVDALAGRYMADRGPELFALDLMLIAESTSEEDKEVIRNFIDASKEAKDSKKIDELKVGTLECIKDVAVRQVFHEATRSIYTQKDAIYAFGDVKERLEKLNNESVVVELKERLKDRVSKFKDKLKDGKERITSVLRRAATGAKAGFERATGVTPTSTTATPSTASETIESITSGTSTEETKGAAADSKTEDKKTSLIEAGKDKVKSAWNMITGATSDISAAFKDALTIPESLTDNVETIADHLENIHLLLKAALGDVKAKEVMEQLSHQVAEAIDRNDKEEKKKSKVKNFDGLKRVGTMLRGIGGAISGAVSAINPFSTSAGSIAAKYKLDTDSPESRLHADFLRYFEYRKEIDVLMAGYAKNSSFFGALGNATKGVAGLIGGTVKHSFGFLKTVGGKTIGAAGKLGGGLAKGLFYKVKTGKNFYDVYRKDNMEVPLLTAAEQENPGVFLLTNPSGEKPKWKILEYSAEIRVPVYNYDKSDCRISQDDIAVGLVDVSGRPITSLTPKEYSGLIPTVAKVAFGTAKIGVGATTTVAKGVGTVAKKVAMKPFSVIAKWGENAKKKKEEKPFINLYTKDADGNLKLLLSAKDQEEGIFEEGTGSLIKRTIDINGPVFKIIDGEHVTVISESDFQRGVVTMDGMSISEMAALANKQGPRGNTFGESVGEGFKNIGGFLKNSAAGVGKLFDVGKIFAGAGGALLKGAGAVGLHALDFGISGLERLFGFDAMSEKRFIKKYKPLMTKLDDIIKHLVDIKSNTQKAYDRENEAHDDEDYKSHQSSAAKPESADKDSKKPGDGGEKKSWMQRIWEFLKDPKAGLLSALSGLRTLGGDIWSIMKWTGSAAWHIGKFALWSLPKALFWTMPKFLVTQGIPAILAAIKWMGNGLGKIFKGNLGKFLTVAGVATAGVGAYNMYKILKEAEDEEGGITKDTVASLDPYHQQLQDGQLMASAGKTLTTIENSVKAIQAQKRAADAAQAAARARQEMEAARRAVDNARRLKNVKKGAKAKAIARATAKLREAQQTVATANNTLGKADDAARVAKAAAQGNGAIKSFRLSKGGSNAILNLTDETGDVAKLLKKCKIDKFLEWCKKLGKPIEELGVKFTKMLANCKTLGAIGSSVKNFFTVGKVAGKSAAFFAKIKPLLRFFSVCKGIVGKFLVGLSYLIEPAMMAVDGYIRNWIHEAAFALDDPSLIDEYEKQCEFGWGRGLTAVFTLGLSEVYQLGASAVSQFSAASIELGQANTGMINTSAKDFRMGIDATKRIEDEQRRQRALDLVKKAERTDVSVEDQEEHSSGWWNVGGHIGEAAANSNMREARKGARKSENARLIGETVDIIDKNPLLPGKHKDDLLNLLQRAFFEQNAKDRHPWGMACYSAVRQLGSVKDYAELERIYSFASDLVNGRKKPADVKEEGLQYVWGQCKISLEELLTEAAKVAQAEQHKRDEKRLNTSPLAMAGGIPEIKYKPLSVQMTKDEETTLDNIFGKRSGKAMDVYGNAEEFVRKYCLEKRFWPENGIYLYGNAIFVFYRNSMDKYLAGCSKPDDEDALYEHYDKTVTGLLRSKYPGLNKHTKISLLKSHKEIFADLDYFGVKSAEESQMYYICECFLAIEIMAKVSSYVPKPVKVEPDKPAAGTQTKPDVPETPETPPQAKSPATGKTKAEIRDVESRLGLVLTKDEITDIIKRSEDIESYRKHLRILVTSKWKYADGSDINEFFELTKQMYIDNQHLYKKITVGKTPAPKDNKGAKPDTGTPKPESATESKPAEGSDTVPAPASTAKGTGNAKVNGIKTPTGITIPGNIIKSLGDTSDTLAEFRTELREYIVGEYPNANLNQVNAAIAMAIKAYGWGNGTTGVKTSEARTQFDADDGPTSSTARTEFDADDSSVPASARKSSKPDTVPAPASTAKGNAGPVVDLGAPTTAGRQAPTSDPKTEQLLARISMLESTLTQYGDTRTLLERLVVLQSDNNSLVEANGKTQAEQTDVFGRKLASLDSQQINLAQIAATAGQGGNGTPPKKVITPVVQLNQGVQG